MFHKKQITTFLISTLALVSLACSSEAPKETKTQEPGKVVMKTLDVKGMTCEGCEGSIVNAVTKIDGVISSKASHVKQSVIIKYDDAKTNINAIMQTISSSGYKVNGLKSSSAEKE